jgi:hypothetical protein
MNRVVESDRHGSRGIASRAVGGNGGGIVDDLLKRIGAVEVPVADIRVQVSAISAVIPHLGTKAEIHALRSDMHSMETRIIKWIVGTGIASATVASAIASVIAKYVT